ncbi:MAG: Hpt domain-containing protein [Acidobacteria bacterium]|nr:Hpt domain-containing protein [Acidobacteriota bacterium]
MDDGVLDPVIVEDLRQAQRECGNPCFIEQLVGIFQASAPERLTLIREAIGARDTKTLTLVAHTLKSNCAMLGATRMASHCAALEQCGESADVATAAALLPEAEAEFPRVLAAVAALATE